MREQHDRDEGQSVALDGNQRQGGEHVTAMPSDMRGCARRSNRPKRIRKFRNCCTRSTRTASWLRRNGVRLGTSGRIRRIENDAKNRGPAAARVHTDTCSLTTCWRTRVLVRRRSSFHPRESFSPPPFRRHRSGTVVDFPLLWKRNAHCSLEFNNCTPLELSNVTFHGKTSSQFDVPQPLWQ